MSKKNEEKWLQVGNFLLGIDTNAHGSYVVLKSVAQNWSVRWKDDTTMFLMMANLMTRAAENENVKEYLHSLVTMMFISTTYLHDLVALSTKHEMPFCQGVAQLLKELNDYEESLKDKPSDEEDEAALKETAETEEVVSEMEKLYTEQ